MPKVNCSLEEQNADLRSNQIAYKFTFENQGMSPIELYSITPRVPVGVEIIKGEDPSLEAAKTKHSRLCSELTEVLNDQLRLLSKDVREKQLQALKEFLEFAEEYLKNTSATSLVLRGYKHMITKKFGEEIEKEREKIVRRYDALSFKIENKPHAELAFEKFLNNEATSDTIKELFQAKIEQIAQLEAEMGKDITSSSIATIETESFFAMTYVLKFPRSSLEPNKYKIDIEVSYAESGKVERLIKSATKTVIVSPNPFILTLTAILSSLLGILLKIAIDTSTQNSQLIFHSEFCQALINGSVVAAAIMAVIFFNIYEFTDVGEKFKMGVGWRSALLIGSLCGLLGDRILIDIKSFIGI